MAPVADHPGAMAVRRTTSRRRIVSKASPRSDGINGRHEVMISSARASGRDRPNLGPLRKGLTRLQRVNGDGGSSGNGSDRNDDDRDGNRNRVQQNPDGNDRDGKDDDGDGRDEDKGGDDGRDGGDNDLPPGIPGTSGEPIPFIPAAITSNPFAGLTSLLPTPLPTLVRTSELSTLRTTALPEPTSAPVETPSPTSTSATMSTLTAFTGLPVQSGDNTVVANNPQIATASALTAMTTTSVIAGTISTPESFVSSLFSTPTAASDLATAPEPTIFIDDNGDNGLNRGGGPPGGLSPTGEDALISAGSIGAFILICFMCWSGWRMYKKRERARNGIHDSDYASPNTFVAKIPYFGRNQRAWQDMEAHGEDSTVMYESASKSVRLGPTVSIYSTNSPRHIAKPTPRSGPMMLPQLDTSVAFTPSSYTQVGTFSASVSSASPYSTLQSQSVRSPRSVSTPHGLQHSDQPALAQLQTSFSPNNVVNNPFASPEDDFAAIESSPSSAAQYGGEGTMQTFQTAATNRTQVPGYYFSPSELAADSPSAAYDPNLRAANRMSELSSISSGFGDGDIIVPPPAAFQQGADGRPFSYAKSAGGLSRHSSVTNRSEAGRNGQRDTVYTATSEDTPARYRSVNSWVTQQTGRVERQQQRDDAEDIPPVPLLPPEQRLTMMMDDGEEPRRYEDTQTSQPPLPSLPN